MEFKTYEQMAIEKLREIEPATRKMWALALEDSYHTMQNVSRRCERLNLIIVDKRKKPYKYRVNEEVFICDNTDCEGKSQKKSLHIVLRSEFNSTTCRWCVDCIKRDNDMIHTILNGKEE